jgi:hypothetical protein
MYVTFLMMKTMKMKIPSVTKMTFAYEFAENVPINLSSMIQSKQHIVSKHQTDKSIL